MQLFLTVWTSTVSTSTTIMSSFATQIVCRIWYTYYSKLIVTSDLLSSDPERLTRPYTPWRVSGVSWSSDILRSLARWCLCLNCIFWGSCRWVSTDTTETLRWPHRRQTTFTWWWLLISSSDWAQTRRYDTRVLVRFRFLMLSACDLRIDNNPVEHWLSNN